jgi:hypothetical protein
VPVRVRQEVQDVPRRPAKPLEPAAGDQRVVAARLHCGSSWGMSRASTTGTGPPSLGAASSRAVRGRSGRVDGRAAPAPAGPAGLVGGPWRELVGGPRPCQCFGQHLGELTGPAAGSRIRLPGWNSPAGRSPGACAGGARRAARRALAASAGAVAARWLVVIGRRGERYRHLADRGMFRRSLRHGFELYSAPVTFRRRNARGPGLVAPWQPPSKFQESHSVVTATAGRAGR